MWMTISTHVPGGTHGKAREAISRERERERERERSLLDELFF
jgi:hypothetical protein